MSLHEVGDIATYVVEQDSLSSWHPVGASDRFLWVAYPLDRQVTHSFLLEECIVRRDRGRDSILRSAYAGHCAAYALKHKGPCLPSLWCYASFGGYACLTCQPWQAVDNLSTTNTALQNLYFTLRQISFSIHSFAFDSCASPR